MSYFSRFSNACCILTFFNIALIAQTQPVTQIKLTDFELQSSTVITGSGEQLSLPGYKSPVYWFPVKVPSTVLTGLVANKVYPDPYTGLNNMLIPDASDEFNKKYNLEQYSHLPGQPNPWIKPYWYRTTFSVPAERSRNYELVFKGINYRAAVWINGKQAADSSVMVGMFAEYFLDVTKFIEAGKINALAIKIWPLDYPGLPAQEQLKALDDFYANGGPAGDIGKNVTMLCSVGWDWIPPVRDRNMGIWQPVYLRSTGPVTISRPHIVTELPLLPDTSVAGISLQFALTNHNTSDIAGKIVVSISPENCTGETILISQNMTLKAGTTAITDLNPSNYKQLSIRNPKLWWPLHYGQPNLYRATIQFTVNDQVTDKYSIVFGIRTVSSKMVKAGKFFHRDFYVNGQRVYLQGGAWVPDMMLNRDSLRYDNEIRLCRNANVNLLRIWGGGVTPPDIFFDLADRYGLLIWSDFWITGDTQGEFKGSPDYPLEGKVFIDNMTSTIYRIRNHPSLLLWTGGNEGHARKELYDAMRDSIISLDGTRTFIPSSSGYAKLPAGWKGSWPDGGDAGVYSGGPYQWMDPHDYYKLAENNIDWAFKDEVGIPSQPPYNSLAKIIPDLVWDSKTPYPMNNSWGYHDACTGNGRYDRYYETMVKLYGAPVSMEDFSDKMQLMNATGYQGIFEAAQHKLKNNGGVMLWKLNAAFPSVIWQIYDWYLQPNAGFYFMQNACEPLHIQLNLNDSVIAIVNRKHVAVKGLTAEAQIYTINSELLENVKATVDADPDGVAETPLSLAPALKKTEGISFVILHLKDISGRVVSRNSYWLEKNNDFKDLQKMTRTNIEALLINKDSDKMQNDFKVQLTNTSKQMAFFIRLQLMDRKEEILPSFWSANYITLVPGESKTITVEAPAGIKTADLPEIQISGWNVNKTILPLK